MNKTYHKFLVIFSVLIIIGGVYFYFSNSLITEASLSNSSSLLIHTGVGFTKNKIASDISFISTLTSLTRIKIDTSLFTDESFQNLKDNTVKLELGSFGRINPFSPINSINGGYSLSSSSITTNNPLEIKNTTAILNGLTNNTSGIISAYFEYGTTNKLGVVTLPANISLIGVFISNIKNLKPRTTYFYKACVKIKKDTLCGEVVSFNTNKL